VRSPSRNWLRGIGCSGRSARELTFSVEATKREQLAPEPETEPDSRGPAAENLRGDQTPQSRAREGLAAKFPKWVNTHFLGRLAQR